METIYFYCAVVGGAVLALQLVFALFGMGGDDTDLETEASIDHGGASDAFFKVLSFKTLVAFFTFFGLAGLGSGKAGVATIPTLLISLGAGGVALYAVAWMMVGMAKLQSSGNLDLENAVGVAGKVYLTVPAARAGRGKVTVTIQGRSVEARAITGGGELRTGSMIRVVGAPAPDLLEVVALGTDEEERV